jgi:hypothetical protein
MVINPEDRASPQSEQSLPFLDEITQKLESEPSAFTPVLQDMMAGLERLRSQCVHVNEWKSIVAHIRRHRVYPLRSTGRTQSQNRFRSP